MDGIVNSELRRTTIGSTLAWRLGVTLDNMVPISKTIKVVGNGVLDIIGGIPVKMTHCPDGMERVSYQLVYMAERANIFFIGKVALDDFGLIPRVEPPEELSEATPSKDEISLTLEGRKDTMTVDGGDSILDRMKPPGLPYIVHYGPMKEKETEIQQEVSNYRVIPVSDACMDWALPLMESSTLSNLLMDPTVVLKVALRLAQIPIYLREKVETSIEKDVVLGIIEYVPESTKTIWCSGMFVVAKKDGSPRQIVDFRDVRQVCTILQPLHHMASFSTGNFGTCIDTRDGHHGIPMEEVDRHITTFITPFGKVRYKVMPQGFLAITNTYYGNYDKTIRGVQRMKNPRTMPNTEMSKSTRECFRQEEVEFCCGLEDQAGGVSTTCKDMASYSPLVNLMFESKSNTGSMKAKVLMFGGEQICIPMNKIVLNEDLIKLFDTMKMSTRC